MINGFVDLLAFPAGYSDLARHVFPFDFEFVDDFCSIQQKEKIQEDPSWVKCRVACKHNL